MRMRPRSVRTRILLLTIVPILCLLGLYSYAATVTLGDALSLARSSMVKNTTGKPLGRFLAQLEAERLLAVVYLAHPTAANRASLRMQEATTADAAVSLHTTLTSGAATSGASPAEKQATAVLLAGLRRLPALQAAVATRAIARRAAFVHYNNLVQDTGQVLDATIRQQGDADVVSQALAFERMGRTGDLLGQENALLSADLSSSRFTPADLQQFTQLAGARRWWYSQTLANLDPQYRAYYSQDVSQQALSTLAALENKVIRWARPGRPPPVQLQAWQQAVNAVSAGLSTAGTQAATVLTRQANTQANITYLNLVRAVILGLMAVLVSIFVSMWLGRRQVGELARLRESALDLAHNSLPDVVVRLAAGEKVELPVPPPPQTARTHEIRQVEEAFASVQQTAVAAAVGQAQLREGVSDMFRNLARRSQSLLQRQLALLDAMERRAKDPQELDDLFRADHLATRMRRHAESLIILSGDTPARGWRHPVPMVDVLRAAVAAVEDYTRIKVSTGSEASLTGPAAGDIIHIVAELAENATIYSPPQTMVTIRGGMTGPGYTVEVEDRGLGISPTHRQQLNSLLAGPPVFDLSGGDQIGLFVTAQLAKRHDVRVSLRPSPYGGTTALVLIPPELIMPEPPPPTEKPALPRAALLAALAASRTGTATRPASAGEPRRADPVPAGAGSNPAERLPRRADTPPPAAASNPPERLPRRADTPPPAAASNPPERLPRRADTPPPAPASNLAARPGESTEPLPAAAAAPRPAAGDALASPGLPRRIPQASLPPQLRNGLAQSRPPPDLPPGPGRSPAETRQAGPASHPERGRSLFDPLPPGYRDGIPGPGEPGPAGDDMTADPANGYPDSAATRRVSSPEDD
jgi:signal transduction histidine kinase